MPVVTAAELQKNFGQVRDQAQSEPVIVTSGGEPSLVLISAAEYERLKELDRRAVRLEELDEAGIEEMLVASIPPGQRYSLRDIPGDG